MGVLSHLFAGSGAIIPVAAYDGVMPLNLLAVPLLRALATGDAETAERLGCLELAEDDMALLTHICPSGHDYGALLRRTLDEIAEQM
jgi:Na+-transporting NADH:ubiquinone oxidoreductase subunit A